MRIQFIALALALAAIGFYDALRAASVPAELHILETGRHGFGLAPGDPPLSIWLTMCETWLRRRGWTR